jgi:hypothetical protein
MSPSPTAPGGIGTYEKLVESIADWLGRNDLGQRIPDFIRLTEADLSRSLNLREQETFKEGVFVEDQDYIEVPDDLQIPRHLRINTDPIAVVSIVSMDKFSQVRENAGNSGVTTPQAATMVGDRFMLAPAPGAGDSYTLFYLGRLVPLSPANSTNRILKDAPDALLYGSLMHSAPYIGDDARIPLWGTLYSQAKEDYRRFEWRSRTSGGPLRVRPDSSVDDRHSTGGG